MTDQTEVSRPVEGMVMPVVGNVNGLAIIRGNKLVDVGELVAAIQAVLDNEMGDSKAAQEFGGYVLDNDVREQCANAIKDLVVA